MAPAAEYAPAGQATQRAVPELTSCVPAAQPVHALAPTVAYWPATHAAHVVDAAAPVAAEYKPAAQAMQLGAPGADWYMPAAQGVQPPAPPAEYRPAAHGTQAVAPMAGW